MIEKKANRSHNFQIFYVSQNFRRINLNKLYELTILNTLYM